MTITAYIVEPSSGISKVRDIPDCFFMPKYPLQSALCVNTYATESHCTGVCIDAKEDNGIITAEFGYGEDHTDDKYTLVFGTDPDKVATHARSLSECDEE